MLLLNSVSLILCLRLFLLNINLFGLRLWCGLF